MWKLFFSPQCQGDTTILAYLHGEPPSSFQRHGDEGDKGVRHCEVEDKVVNIGPTPGYGLELLVVGNMEHPYLISSRVDFL